jgi:hypothetical protein
MLVKHKSNPWFMFHTSKWLRRFTNWILHLEDEIVEEIKKTEDYQNWLIELEEKEVIPTQPAKKK